MTLSGAVQRDERKQTADEVSKLVADVKTASLELSREKSEGLLITGRTASGMKAA
jgi:hypothetical protein